MAALVAAGYRYDRSCRYWVPPARAAGAPAASIVRTERRDSKGIRAQRYVVTLHDAFATAPEDALEQTAG